MAVTLSFLGGLRTVGRNCMVLEDDGRLLIVDCGLLFPDMSNLGVDLAIPDFRFFEGREASVAGVVLTHAHEDHIGALSFLSEHLSTVVYGSEFSLSLVLRRLEESGAESRMQLRPVRDRESVDVGPFRIEFLPVTHSVPMSHALAITTSEGLIYHSGDFKLDPDPLDGRLTDLARLRELSVSPGIRLLLLDSTNAEEPGRTEPERAVHPALAAAMNGAGDRRVIVTCFASHLHRIAQIADVARQHGRRIVPVGRSMERVLQVGRELGLIELLDENMALAKDLSSMPPSEVCILSTGSQGEPRAALSLMSRGEHRSIKLSESDLIVISADAIPGNEPDVGRLIDNLHRTGAEVVHAGMSKVHVSGHANRDELHEIMALAKPRHLIPVHGEFRHMINLARLSQGTDLPEIDVRVCEDGDVITLDSEGLRKSGSFPAPFVYASNNRTDFIEASTVRERRNLLSAGVLCVVLGYDRSRAVVDDIVALDQFGWIGQSRMAEVGLLLQRDLVGTELKLGPKSVSAIEEALRGQVQRILKRGGFARPIVVVTCLDEYVEDEEVTDDDNA